MAVNDNKRMSDHQTPLGNIMVVGCPWFETPVKASELSAKAERDQYSARW